MKSNKSIINGFINSGKRVKRELDSYSRDAIRIRSLDGRMDLTR